MQIKWAEIKRNKELVAFIKNKNDTGSMPSTRSIYKTVDMAKATALRYLSILEAKGIVEYKMAGPTKLWYISKDDKGNILIPKIIFVKKSDKTEKLI